MISRATDHARHRIRSGTYCISLALHCPSAVAEEQHIAQAGDADLPDFEPDSGGTGPLRPGYMRLLSSRG